MRRPAKDVQQTAYGSELVVVNFATKGFYEDHQWGLRRELMRFGMDHDLQLELRPAESWVECCARKAEYCRRMLALHQRPVLWLDADARPRRRVDVADMVPATVRPSRAFAAYCPRHEDRALGRRHFPLVNSNLLSGTLLFFPVPAARRLLDLWVEQVAAAPGRYDQESLYAAVKLWGPPPCAFHNLSPEFVCVPDLMPGVVPAIEHLQASRDARSGKT